jgi:hypothetical protein
VLDAKKDYTMQIWGGQEEVLAESSKLKAQSLKLVACRL